MFGKLLLDFFEHLVKCNQLGQVNIFVDNLYL